MTTPESIGEFRKGDEPEDSRIGDFKVYGGTPADRARLQNGDPDIHQQLGDELDDILERFTAES